MKETFDEHFSEEMREWLLAEMKLNKQEPLPQGQMHFWEQPKNDCDHDSRGCPCYVSQYIDTLSSTEEELEQGAACAKTHRPHPNIIDVFHNKITEVLPRSPNPSSKTSKVTTNNSHDSDSNSSDTDLSDKIEELELSEEYQIPGNSEFLPGLAHTGPTEKVEKKKPKKGSNKFFLAI